MDWIVEQFFGCGLGYKLGRECRYLDGIIEIFDYIFSNGDEDGYSSYFLIDWSFLFVIIDEIDVVGEDGEGSPEKEAIDPPTQSISILLCIT